MPRHGPARPTCCGCSQTPLPPGAQGVALGNVHLRPVSYWLQRKHIHHLRKLEAFFQDLFERDEIPLQSEEVCTDRNWDTRENARLPQEVCVWNHVTGGDEMLATCPCPLILASDNSRPPSPGCSHPLTFPGPCSPPGARKQQLLVQSFSLGSHLQNRMFLHLKKQARKTESYHISACSGKI